MSIDTCDLKKRVGSAHELMLWERMMRMMRLWLQSVGVLFRYRIVRESMVNVDV